ncbi:SKN1-domain-containing protein [Marasmius fiardii PR-910]|nr:SKN1-domain-containing protein [Marasmius fiardii PR-910]
MTTEPLSKDITSEILYETNSSLSVTSNHIEPSSVPDTEGKPPPSTLSSHIEGSSPLLPSGSADVQGKSPPSVTSSHIEEDPPSSVSSNVVEQISPAFGSIDNEGKSPSSFLGSHVEGKSPLSETDVEGNPPPVVTSGHNEVNSPLLALGSPDIERSSPRLTTSSQVEEDFPPSVSDRVDIEGDPPSSVISSHVKENSPSPDLGSPGIEGDRPLSATSSAEESPQSLVSGGVDIEGSPPSMVINSQLEENSPLSVSGSDVIEGNSPSSATSRHIKRNSPSSVCGNADGRKSLSSVSSGHSGPARHSGPRTNPDSNPDSQRVPVRNHRRGGSIVLYRLAGENEAGSKRASVLSTLYEFPPLFTGDDKYPMLRPSGRSCDSHSISSGQRSPYALRLYNASPEPNAVFVSNPPRGFIAYEYDPVADPHEEDDILHDPRFSKEETEKVFGMHESNWRGLSNMIPLSLLVCGLIGLFLVYPVTDGLSNHTFGNALKGSFSTIPPIPNARNLIDKDTPEVAKTRIGFDGQRYELVYSDEFNEPGRTFYPGDDPYLEAMDFWYGVTQDMEWYDPGQVITRDGALVITLDSNTTLEAGLTPGSTAPFKIEDNHGLAYRSGMLQSWNKFCFTNGYIEVSVILPGSSEESGFWPGAWTMGNLGRPGYPASTDAMWPYSYDECDLGTFPNQTEKGNTGPPAAIFLDKGWSQYDMRLSMLRGQRLSACTCPSSDHPGPFGKLDSGSDVERYRGRGAPEIDVIEIQHNDIGPGNVASQSAQFAPFTHGWEFDKTGYTIYDTSKTHYNGYTGSPFQQAVSGLTLVPDDGFQNAPNKRFVTYGFEYWADADDRDNGYITWQMDGKQSVKLMPKAVGPDKGPDGSQVGQRIIPEEPMALILNLGISHNWAGQFANLTFPAEMMFDYIRVYQREGHTNIGCDPKDYPTMDYINRHIDQYTIWDTKSVWEYEVPKNRLYDGC